MSQQDHQWQYLQHVLQLERNIKKHKFSEWYHWLFSSSITFQLYVNSFFKNVQDEYNKTSWANFFWHKSSIFSTIFPIRNWQFQLKIVLHSKFTAFAKKSFAVLFHGEVSSIILESWFTQIVRIFLRHFQNLFIVGYLFRHIIWSAKFGEKENNH